MDPTSRVIAMGAAGAGSSVVNFAAKLVGGANNHLSPSSAVDKNNNFYIAFNDNASSPSSTSAYIAKYSSLGTLVWQIKLSNASGYSTSVYSIATDSNGDIVLGGGFNYTTSAIYPAIFKLNSNGSMLWQVAFGINNVTFENVTVDSSDNILALAPNGGNLLTFNSSGTLLSQKRLTSAVNDSFSAYRVRSVGGNLYIMGGGTTSGGSLAGVAVLRFDTAGNFSSGINTTRSGTNATPGYGAIQIDSSGNVYVAMSYSSDYVYLFKYNSSLSIQWSKALTVGTSAGKIGLAIDATGDSIYVSSPAVGISADARAIQKFDSTGSLIWERSIDGGSYFSNGALSIASTGDVMAVQTYYDGSSFNNTLSYLIPSNGSKTGTYLGTTYLSASFGASTSSTVNSSLNFTLVTNSWSTLGITATVSTSSLTSTIANLV